MPALTHLQQAMSEHEAELERARQLVEKLEGQREVLATALRAIGDSPVSVAKPRSRRRRTRTIDTDAFVNALRELGGSADNEALKGFFGVDTGNALTGGRTGAMKQGLVQFDDGVYTLAE